MLADLASRGFKDADIAGMQLEFKGVEGADFTAFWYTVESKDQRRFVYRVDEGGMSVNGVSLGIG